MKKICKPAGTENGENVYCLDDGEKKAPVREVLIDEKTILIRSYSPKTLEIELSKHFPGKDISINLNK